jgi:hypothetical protein
MTALHELTIKAIRRAQAQGGIVDPVEDWTAIAELDRLARAATEMAPEDKLLFLDLPVTVGNISLYRLSWGASDWLTELAMDWFQEEPSMLDRAVVFAHVFARDPSKFRTHSDITTARKGITQWSRECSASIESMVAAVDRLTLHVPSTKEPEKKIKESKTASNGPIFDRLMADYKQPIEYFLWEMSAESLSVLINANTLKHDAESRSYESAAGKAPDTKSKFARQTIAFQRAAREFMSRMIDRQKKGSAT